MLIEFQKKHIKTLSKLINKNTFVTPKINRKLQFFIGDFAQNAFYIVNNGVGLFQRLKIER